MGRPPCCDKNGVKKGPWTPEEDIILVSYIQQHGPGNWKAIPANTGLLRCSKSCRLRWTNYLRPGIKRGGFTEHEEKMIIHLQALLGNKWAAIASYLNQRTDNDIKNYWNTHLKKKLQRLSGGGGQEEDANKLGQHGNFSIHGITDPTSSSSSSEHSSRSASKGRWERRLQTDINTAKQALCEALSIDKSNANNPSMNTLNRLLSSPPIGPSTYASSADNIARLLENWTKKTPISSQAGSVSADSTATASLSNNALTSSPSEGAIGEANNESKGSKVETKIPFSLLENWLLEEDAAAEGGDGDFMDMAAFGGDC